MGPSNLVLGLGESGSPALTAAAATKQSRVARPANGSSASTGGSAGATPRRPLAEILLIPDGARARFPARSRVSVGFGCEARVSIEPGVAVMGDVVMSVATGSRATRHSD